MAMKETGSRHEQALHKKPIPFLSRIRAVPPPATPGGLKPFPSSCAVSEVLFSFAEMPNQCTSNQPRVARCGGSSHMMCPAGINALSVSLVNLHRAPPGELQ